MKEQDKFLKIVGWSEEDQCYVGSIPGWIGKCCHGSDEKKVFSQLGMILNEWIELYHKDKRPLPPPTNRKYSGKFVLRVGEDLHKALAIRALAEGESLNYYVAKNLKNLVHSE